MRSAGTVRLVAVLMLLAVCSCGGGGDDQGLATASTTVPQQAETTTAPSSTTTTAPPSTTTTAATVCDAGPRPEGAVASTEAPGDFDGDGNPDTLVVYGAGTDDDPAPWHIRIELAGGGTVDAPIPDATGPGAGRALGGAEISASAGLPPDGSGVEAFAAVGSGASVTLVGVYQLTGCVLTRLNGPDGNPSTFAIGGTVTHGGGLRCDGISGGQRLVLLAAESADAVTYNTSETVLAVAGGALVQANPPVVGTLAMPADSTPLQDFYSLQCEGVAGV